MIFNKFRPIPFCNKLKAFSFQLLALSLFSCNKSASVNANKSFVGLTHVAYGVGPVSVTINGLLLYSSPLAFGLTTGVPGNPYDTTVSRISELNIFLAQDTSMSIHGNAAFQQGSHYSIFFFDTLDPRSVTLIILQDNPPVRTDTFTYIRYMNFSPDSSWGIKLINTRNDIPYFADTINIGPSLFVGNNINPSAYYFSQVRIGNYNVFAYRDSINPAPDSSNFIHLGPLQIDSTINYNVYLQGFFTLDSGVNKFQLKSVPLN
jgi:hypothetical protein